ncbi:MAG: 2-dehydro-3-deoxygalactonokinase [Alphaproteobacteria bacterium]
MTVIIGVDWGSTHLRIYRLEGGVCVDKIHSTMGAKELIGKGSHAFERVFVDAAGSWIDDAQAIYVSGMATSKNAWFETSYIDCPCDLRKLGAGALQTAIQGKPVFLLPGIADTIGPDVIRGEEVQLLGLSGEGKQRVVVLPGTHSKWVQISGFRILGFRTFMTGEVFELARYQSLGGRLAEGEGFDRKAFENGLAQSEAGLLNSLFSARPRVLLGNMKATATHSFLSGVTIGSEVREAQTVFDITDKELLLHADGHLATLYMQALSFLGLDYSHVSASATSKGFNLL